MNKRGAGICFYLISTLLFALVVVTHITIFNASNWTSEDSTYQKIMFLEHLCGGLSILSLIAGTFYIIKEEMETGMLKNIKK